MKLNQICVIALFLIIFSEAAPHYPGAVNHHGIQNEYLSDILSRDQQIGNNNQLSDSMRDDGAFQMIYKK